MGLDMYLSVSDYVSGWEFGKDERFDKVMTALGFDPDLVAEGSPSMTVQVKVAYWRKANAIHNWFVQNCQDGRDECQETEVSRDDLQALLVAAEGALDHYNAGRKTEAAEILPPTAGFFFGSTDVDEWYAENLKNTIEQLNKILNSEQLKNKWFIYQSSW